MPRRSFIEDFEEGTGTRGPKPRGFTVRFWEKTVIAGLDECWEWRGSIAKKTGYGTISIHNRHRLAHRVSYLIEHGSLDPNLLVMHTCDNRKCVNPAHLIQGTDKQNIQDAIEKGRMLKGELNGMSKLTAEQVMLIRSAHLGGATIGTLASFYNVWPACISRIVKRQRWAHL